MRKRFKSAIQIFMKRIIKPNNNKGKTTDNWYQIHEQGAGTFRLELLWYVYRILGVRILKLVLYPVAFFITIFARPARRASREYRQILNTYQRAHNMHVTRFSSFTHIRMFANSLADKITANCDTRPKLKFTHDQTPDWDEFMGYLGQNHGIFLICSHLGNVHTLPGFSQDTAKTMHAFMQIGHTGTFNKFMQRHSKNRNTKIYATENIDIGIAGAMYDNLKSGDMVMMAGDRISAQQPSRQIPIRFLDCDCVLPIGTFKFAQLMDHPTFAITVINTGAQRYQISVRKLPTTNPTSMAQTYASFLETQTLRHPHHWFNFYDFFGPK